MPDSFMTLFPQVLNSLEAIKIPIQTVATLAEMTTRSLSLGFDLIKKAHDVGLKLANQSMSMMFPSNLKFQQLFEIYQENIERFYNIFKENSLQYLDHFRKEREGELEFINLFTEEPYPQDWTIEYDRANILLDLPSLRLIDISSKVKHTIQNYSVVFAPRAGHHSNIAERVALFMRDHGLTRMAIVEQKCAEEVPLFVEGERHYENFDGQVAQYHKILQYLKERTGYAPHLIGICQPGPLLMSSLILNPDLGRTFGSAGAPMHTGGEKGLITDFARMMGEGFVDKLITLFGKTVSEDKPGAGREAFDGRIQILGFYLAGIDQHFRNFKKLLADLKRGNEEDAQRQKDFYLWYNYVHHFPVGFIRDTHVKIFIRNELIRGELTIVGKKIGIKDYPGFVPIWALGGTKDDITPPLQAIGHMNLIDSVPSQDKLTLLCDGGHMGLFRSHKILENYYTKIIEFILAHSDRTNN
ncbi:MAG: hypothetical protein AB1502_16140 [Thermodesulfobacteriota bacterium]